MDMQADGKGATKSVHVKTTEETDWMLKEIMAYATDNPLMIWSEFTTKRITKNAIMNSLIVEFFNLFIKDSKQDYRHRRQDLMNAKEPLEIKKIRRLLTRIDQTSTETLMISLSNYASSKSNLTPTKVSSEAQLGYLSDADSLLKQWHNHFREKMDHDVTVNRQTNYR